jgi:hypothetical protein
MSRQDSQLGQRFPRAGWMGNASRALPLLLHLRNHLGYSQYEGSMR